MSVVSAKTHCENEHESVVGSIHERENDDHREEKVIGSSGRK